MYSLEVIQYMNSPAGLKQFESMTDDCESCKYRHPDTCKPCRQDIMVRRACRAEKRRQVSHRKYPKVQNVSPTDEELNKLVR